METVVGLMNLQWVTINLAFPFWEATLISNLLEKRTAPQEKE